MPYVNKESKEYLNEVLKSIENHTYHLSYQMNSVVIRYVDGSIQSTGVNYLLTVLMNKQLSRFKKHAVEINELNENEGKTNSYARRKEESYDYYNYVIGCLEFAKKEMLEFISVPHEKKIDLLGAFECAKMEMYRRKIALYEDKKIAENGDVYE